MFSRRCAIHFKAGLVQKNAANSTTDGEIARTAPDMRGLDIAADDELDDHAG
jgi:hypothetical protein